MRVWSSWLLLFMVLGSQSSRQKLLSEDLRKALVRSEKTFGHSYERDVDEIYPTLQNPHENIAGTFKTSTYLRARFSKNSPNHAGSILRNIQARVTPALFKSSVLLVTGT